jgi:hypothetical protein
MLSFITLLVENIVRMLGTILHSLTDTGACDDCQWQPVCPGEMLCNKYRNSRPAVFYRTLLQIHILIAQWLNQPNMRNQFKSLSTTPMDKLLARFVVFMKQSLFAQAEKVLDCEGYHWITTNDLLTVHFVGQELHNCLTSSGRHYLNNYMLFILMKSTKPCVAIAVDSNWNVAQIYGKQNVFPKSKYFSAITSLLNHIDANGYEYEEYGMDTVETDCGIHRINNTWIDKYAILDVMKNKNTTVKMFHDFIYYLTDEEFDACLRYHHQLLEAICWTSYDTNDKFSILYGSYRTRESKKLSTKLTMRQLSKVVSYLTRY